MRRAFKYRLFTNINQERELSIMLETNRRLYNACLAQRISAFKTEQKTVSFYEQCLWFTQDKKTNPFYARLNTHSAQATMRRLDKAFKNFFRRVNEGSSKPGFPRFKGKDRFNSIEFSPYGDGIKLNECKLYVQHVGNIRVKLHRPIEGKIKTVALKREADKWFVVFSCELPDIPVVKSDKPVVGIDVGLTHFFTTSEGKREANPRYLKKTLPELRRAGRAVSRKKKGGSNRRKAVRRLRKVHLRVKNLRREHHYQVAHRLVLAYGLIAVESLNISGMLGNHRFSRAISDAGWSSFLSVLHHKAEKAGVEFVEVNCRGTSQECSQCGQVVPKDLRVRVHSCSCGLVLDRDWNAAKNILARARLARTEPAKANVDQRVRRSSRSLR